MRNRGSEFLGHFIALRLVGGETDVSRRGCRGIEGHSQMRRIFLFENRQQRVDESVKRRGVDALGVADRRLDQREVGAVNERHAVEQEQALGGGFGHDWQCEIVCPLRSGCRLDLQHRADVPGGELSHGAAGEKFVGAVHAVELCRERADMLARRKLFTAHDA